MKVKKIQYLLMGLFLLFKVVQSDATNFSEDHKKNINKALELRKEKNKFLPANEKIFFVDVIAELEEANLWQPTIHDYRGSWLKIDKEYPSWAMENKINGYLIELNESHNIEFYVILAPPVVGEVFKKRIIPGVSEEYVFIRGDGTIDFKGFYDFDKDGKIDYPANYASRLIEIDEWKFESESLKFDKTDNNQQMTWIQEITEDGALLTIQPIVSVSAQSIFGKVPERVKQNWYDEIKEERSGGWSASYQPENFEWVLGYTKYFAMGSRFTVHSLSKVKQYMNGRLNPSYYKFSQRFDLSLQHYVFAAGEGLKLLEDSEKSLSDDTDDTDLNMVFNNEYYNGDPQNGKVVIHSDVEEIRSCLANQASTLNTYTPTQVKNDDVFANVSPRRVYNDKINLYDVAKILDCSTLTEAEILKALNLYFESGYVESEKDTKVVDVLIAKGVKIHVVYTSDQRLLTGSRTAVQYLSDYFDTHTQTKNTFYLAVHYMTNYSKDDLYARILGYYKGSDGSDDYKTWAKLKQIAADIDNKVDRSVIDDKVKDLTDSEISNGSQKDRTKVIKFLIDRTAVTYEEPWVVSLIAKTPYYDWDDFESDLQKDDFFEDLIEAIDGDPYMDMMNAFLEQYHTEVNNGTNYDWIKESFKSYVEEDVLSDFGTDYKGDYNSFKNKVKEHFGKSAEERLKAELSKTPFVIEGSMYGSTTVEPRNYDVIEGYFRYYFWGDNELKTLSWETRLLAIKYYLGLADFWDTDDEKRILSLIENVPETGGQIDELATYISTGCNYNRLFSKFSDVWIDNEKNLYKLAMVLLEKISQSKFVDFAINNYQGVLQKDAYVAAMKQGVSKKNLIFFHQNYKVGYTESFLRNTGGRTPSQVQATRSVVSYSASSPTCVNDISRFKISVGGVVSNKPSVSCKHNCRYQDIEIANINPFTDWFLFVDLSNPSEGVLVPGFFVQQLLEYQNYTEITASINTALKTVGVTVALATFIINPTCVTLIFLTYEVASYGLHSVLENQANKDWIVKNWSSKHYEMLNFLLDFTDVVVGFADASGIAKAGLQPDDFLSDLAKIEKKLADPSYKFPSPELKDWYSNLVKVAKADGILKVSDDAVDLTGNLSQVKSVLNSASEFEKAAGSGVVDVLIHSNGSSFIIDGVEKSASEIAAFLPSGQRIRLLSCNNIESAQELATTLNREVIANPGITRIHADGAITVVPNPLNGTDTKWYVCKPNGTKSTLDLPSSPTKKPNDFLELGKKPEFVNGAGKVLVNNWNEAVTAVDNVINTKVIQLNNLYPNAKIGYRGSLSTGTKYSTGGPFDPTDWDVDAFIVSDNLASQIGGSGFRNGRNIQSISNIADDLENSFKSISGYRTELNKPFTFRVFTEAEFNSIVKPNGYKLFE